MPKKKRQQRQPNATQADYVGTIGEPGLDGGDLGGGRAADAGVPIAMEQ